MKTMEYSEYMKVKKLTNMKSFFTRSGVEWPDMKWINTDSILQEKNLPAVPEGIILSSL